MRKKKLPKILALALAILLWIPLVIPTYATDFADYNEQYREKTKYTDTIQTVVSFSNNGYCYQNQPYITCNEHVQPGGGVVASGTRYKTETVEKWTDWSVWQECEGICPTGNSSRQIETRRSYALKVDEGNGNVYAEYGENGKTIDIPTPSKEGHTFTGWEYVGTGNFNSNNNQYTFDSAVGNLTATYRINQYRVNLFYNGSQVVDDMYDYGTTFTTHSMDGTLIDTYVNEAGIDKEIIPPEEQGYNFVSWKFNDTDNSIQSIYTKKVYQVTFLGFDGKEIHKEEVLYQQAPTPPTPPKVEGYTFTGWDKDFSSIEGDLVVSAKYEINRYPVKITNNKTTVLSEEMKHFSQISILDKDKNLVKKIEITEPYQEDISPLVYYGYDFVKYTVETIDDNKTIVPNYDAKTWLVQFVGQDGTTVISREQVKHNSTVKAPTPPKIYGYIFVGWDKPLTNISSDQTITAMYSDDPSVPRFNVTFTVNGENQKYGSLVLDNKQVYSLNVNMVISGTKLADILPTHRAKENSKFQGYFVKDKKIDPSTYKVETIDEVELRFYPDSNNNDIDDRTENVIVTWETNGGSIIEPTSVVMNSTLKEFPTPKKDGHTFEGWYTSSSFYQQWMKSDKFTKDTILYAKWSVTPNTSATVTWETNGGSSIADSVVGIGSKVIEPTSPTKQGSKFEGWYTSSSLSQKWYFSNKVDKDITLYAKWIKDENTNTKPTPGTGSNVKPEVTPTPEEDANVNPRITDPNRGKAYTIKFIDVDGKHINSVTMYYAQQIYIRDEQNNISKEYAVRQDTVITLPEEREMNGYVFNGWNSFFDKNNYDTYELYPEYKEVVELEIEQSEDPFIKVPGEDLESATNMAKLFGVAILGVLIIFVTCIGLLMIRARKKKNHEGN